jgi:hypothetical protein
MANSKDTVSYILSRLGNSTRITTRIDRGECHILADGMDAAIISDDLLYIPVRRESAALEPLCEKDVPFLGADMHYVISEDQVARMPNLSKILFAIARSGSR